MDFRIIGLPAEPFAHLMAMDAEELTRNRAIRYVADCTPGFPCRITLEDAQPGEHVLLVHFEHLAVDSPYRSSHAIYVRAAAREPFNQINKIPPALVERLLSVRAFDSAGMMLDADLVEGRELPTLVDRLLALPDVSYLHAHYARRGCFAARIERA